MALPLAFASVAHAGGSFVPLDRVVPLDIGLKAGGSVTLTGSVQSSFDGTVFDALVQRSDAPNAKPYVGGLFDAEAGGLRVVEQHQGTHVYTLAATGAIGRACAAAGVSSPCLATRLPQLAHERLLTQAELARSLSGGVDIDVAATSPSPPEPAKDHGVLGLGIAFAAAFAAIASWRFARARRNEPLGQVYAAARKARRAIRKDPTLAVVGAQIDDMVLRAQRLDEARRACSKKHAGMDLRGIDAKRASWARSGAAEAPEVLEWLTAEAAEAARLRVDISSSMVGLDRIASALRVLALRARDHRGTRARVATHDPVDALASELSIRDEAIAETDKVTARL